MFICQAGPGHPERNHQLMFTQPQQHPLPRETRPTLQCRVFAALAQKQGSTFSLVRFRMTLIQAQGGYRAAGFESDTGTEQVGSAALSSLGGTRSPRGVP